MIRLRKIAKGVQMAVVAVSPQQYLGIQTAITLLRNTPGFDADQLSLHLQADPRYVPYRLGGVPQTIPYIGMQDYYLNSAIESHQNAADAFRHDPGLYSAQMAAQIDAIFDRWNVITPTAQDIGTHEAPPVLPPSPQPTPPAPQPMPPLWDARGNVLTAYSIDPFSDFNTTAQVPLNRPLTINDVPGYWISDDVACRPVYDPQNLEQIGVVLQYMQAHPQDGILSTLSMETMRNYLSNPLTFQTSHITIDRNVTIQSLSELTFDLSNVRILSAEDSRIAALEQVCDGESGFFSWDTVECFVHRFDIFNYSVVTGIISGIPSGVALLIDGVDNIPRLWGDGNISGREGFRVVDTHDFIQRHFNNASRFLGIEPPIEIDDTDFWVGVGGALLPALITGGATIGSAAAGVINGGVRVLGHAGPVISTQLAGRIVIGSEVSAMGVVLGGEFINAPPPPPPLPSANLPPLF